MANPAQSSNPSTVGASWEEATDKFEQRCALVVIWGLESSGKTSLALTAPGPTGVLHSAEKIGGVYQAFVKAGLKLRKFNFGFVATTDEASTAERARAVWAKWKANYIDAFTKWAKTIIVDTEPDAWVLRRFAKFGTLQPKGDTRDLYSSVNFDWKQLFKNRFREQAESGRGCNLILISTATDEYKDIITVAKFGPKKGTQVKESHRTGKQKMEGMKSIKFWADVILYCWKELDLTTGQNTYHVRIDKGWFNGMVEGMDLTDEFMRALDFSEHPVTKSCLHWASIMAYITDTPEAEWKK